VAEHKILQKSYNDYLGVEEAVKELILYAIGDDALALLKKLYWLWRHNGARNVRPPLPQNSNLNDNIAEARVQDNGIHVIGHGIGGKYIPIMARLAKARRRSKR